VLNYTGHALLLRRRYFGLFYLFTEFCKIARQLAWTLDLFAAQRRSYWFSALNLVCDSFTVPVRARNEFPTPSTFFKRTVPLFRSGSDRSRSVVQFDILVVNAYYIEWHSAVIIGKRTFSSSYTILFVGRWSCWLSYNDRDTTSDNSLYPHSMALAPPWPFCRIDFHDTLELLEAGAGKRSCWTLACRSFAFFFPVATRRQKPARRINKTQHK